MPGIGRNLPPPLAAFANLFHRSGWTQEQLAKKEGKSQPWIVVRLRFGRFLKFITGSNNSEEAWNLIKKTSSRAQVPGFPHTLAQLGIVSRHLPLQSCNVANPLPDCEGAAHATRSAWPRAAA